MGVSPLGNLPSFERLSATETNFFGSIPDAFVQLEKIQIISLSVNRLSSTIAPSIFNRSSITIFGVNGNRIMVRLP